MFELFNRHPRTVDETYLEHMGVASSFGFRMIVAGCACLIHGLLPFTFVKTGRADMPWAAPATDCDQRRRTVSSFRFLSIHSLPCRIPVGSSRNR
jgi:hypothetical protein